MSQITVKTAIRRIRYLSEIYMLEDIVVSDILQLGLVLCNEIDPVKNITRQATPGELDDLRRTYNKVGYEFDHFTIKSGKAKYHYLYLSDNSYGLYYALREMEDGSLAARRAVEPSDTINVNFVLKK